MNRQEILFKSSKARFSQPASASFLISTLAADGKRALSVLTRAPLSLLTTWQPPLETRLVFYTLRSQLWRFTVHWLAVPSPRLNAIISTGESGGAAAGLDTDDTTWKKRPETINLESLILSHTRFTYTALYIVYPMLLIVWRKKCYTGL